jgi:hypothetical protein
VDAGSEGELLAGGVMNAGSVVKVGDVVRRPSQPHVGAIHDLLRGLVAHGFDGAPTPLGVGPDGREGLSFVPGDVPLPPFPDWSLSDEVLASVGLLLRRFHHASAAVPVDLAVSWPMGTADPEGGAMLCHNDVCPENVVFRDGRAVALIDFDLAAPGRPIWDLAMTARYWVPMVPPEFAVASGRSHLDPVRRLRLLVEAYGLPPHEWSDVVPALQTVNKILRRFVAKQLADGHDEMRRTHEELGGWQRWDGIDRWLSGFSWI